MIRVNDILHHPRFEDALRRLAILEADRLFCRHDLTHLLDVARIMWIETLENHLPLSRETVYASAMLHDIGRAEQLEGGRPHEEAGAALAAIILPEVGFSHQETAEILSAIHTHRGHIQTNQQSPLGELLQRADKLCRPCWCCPSAGPCNWPEDRKNSGISR